MMNNQLILMYGSNSKKIAQEVAGILEVNLTSKEISTFTDSEPWLQISKKIDFTGKDVFIIQSTSDPVLKSYDELWSMLENIRLRHPKKLVAVMPFMGFRRMDWDKLGGETIKLHLYARLTREAGATEIILCDPHTKDIQSFFDIPVHVIDANPVFYDNVFKNKNLEDYAVLRCDKGRETCCCEFANLLKLPLVRATKTKQEEGNLNCDKLDGSVSGKHIIIREDEIATASTLGETCKELISDNAIDAIVVATHPVLSADAIRIIKDLKKYFIEKVYTSNSIYLPDEKQIKEIDVTSISPAIADEITKICNE